ncbi:MAG: EamA family transporter [Patescibacteria group bacterium]
MLWLVLALIGYILNALATLISKWLLIKDIPEPVVFTFYIGVFNLVALVLIPFGFYVPSALQILIALISGASYAWAMYYLAVALNKDQASQVAPMIGGLQPVFVLAFAWWFLPETLVFKQYIGIALIVFSTIFLALEVNKKRLFTESVKYILLSSVLFGLSYALLKLVYIEQGFVSGFVWTRIGTFAFVAILAALPGNWKLITKSSKKSKPAAKEWFVVGQILGAVSFLLVSYAISLGPVTIINALQGIQYAFLFVFIVLVARWHPRMLDEPLTKSVVLQKTLAILVLIIGLALSVLP